MKLKANNIGMKGNIMGKIVLVLGASGLFGSHAAKAFAAKGWEVRKYKRGTDMNRAAEGVDVIVNGLNPPRYHDWDRLIPAITRQVIEAGLSSGATVLVPGNVYVYGREAGPWGPQTPQIPASRKGAIRVAMEADLRAASERGLQVILLRGGDFLAPEVDQSFWNMVTLEKLDKGKITIMTRPEVIRAYAYLPDMARIAVALAEKRADLQGYTDMPYAGYTLSMNDLKADLERLIGHSLRFTKFPWLLMTLASPFWELGRELREMRYLYDLPHAIDPAPLAKLLPDFRPTPLDTILAEHIAHHMPVQGSVSMTEMG
jgi:nucleoside-diphosphate-sugar epimerase